MEKIDEIKRMKYFDRQFLRAKDFQDEQKYNLDKRRRHNCNLHGSGVIEGLEVKGGVGNDWITVDDGIAIDPSGREVVWQNPEPDPEHIEIPGTVSDEAKVFLMYCEEPSDPSSDPGVSGDTRITEYSKIIIQEGPLPDGVLLATIKLNESGKLSEEPNNDAKKIISIKIDDSGVNRIEFSDGTIQETAGGGGGGLWSKSNDDIYYNQGNVGIGTTEPKHLLHIFDETDPALKIQSSGELSGRISFRESANYGADIYYDGRSKNQGLAIETFSEGDSSGVRLFIKEATGNVGVGGTTDPGQKLEVYNGNLAVNRGNIYFTQEPAPRKPTVAVSLQVGTLDGEYTYRVTFVTAQGETEGGEISTPVTPKNKMVNLKNIPTGTSGVVTARKIYRTTAGGNQHRLLTTINNNRDTSYNDNVPDISLTDNVPTSNTTTAGFFVGKVNRIQIDQNGNVGIGTTSPGSFYKLHVEGNAYKTIGGDRWATPSDLRMKKNVKTLKESLDNLLKLRGVSFEWKEPEKHGSMTGKQMGLVAQEIEEIFPEWVSTDPEGYKNLNIIGFEALAIEAIRELNDKNENLQKKVLELETKIKALEKKLK